MTYPKFLYHATEAPKGRLLHSIEEEIALGAGWVDTPAKFSAKEPAAPTKKSRTKKAE